MDEWMGGWVGGCLGGWVVIYILHVYYHCVERPGNT